MGWGARFRSAEAQPKKVELEKPLQAAMITDPVVQLPRRIEELERRPYAPYTRASSRRRCV
jgi:hypothetical protein